MPLDPSIILQAGRGVVPLKDPSEIADEQAARQMRALQLQQAQQGITDDQTARGIAMNTGADQLPGAYQKAGLLKQAQQAQGLQNEQQKSAYERGKAVTDAMKVAADLVMQNPTEQAAIAALDDISQRYKIPASHFDAGKAAIYAARNDPGKIRQLMGGLGAKADEALGKIENVNLGGVQQSQRTNPYTGELQVLNQQARSASPDSMLSAQTSTANNQATVTNSRQNAQMADTRAREFNDTKVEENRLKREQKQDTADMTKAGQVASFDTMLGTLDRLGSHPGLARSVGMMSKFPTAPGSDSANFQAELESFKSQAFVPMVAQLKGMGALSDAEGRKLTQAVGALDPNMGEKAFRDSVKRITEDMNAARARVVGNKGGATGSFDAPAQKQPIQLGMRRNGYIYKGGNPNDKASWEPEK